MKKMNFTSIFLLGINGIIGSGIFLIPNKLYQDMGVGSILVILLAALMVFMIALCYGELASIYPKGGGSWRYVYETFGRFAGFEIGLVSWLLAITILATETAALLTTLQGIFTFLNNSLYYQISGVLILLLLMLANFMGLNFMRKLNNLSSFAKLAMILFFIVVGMFFVKIDHLSELLPVSADTPMGLFKDVAKAMSVVFYGFVGFSFLPVNASRMQNPQKNLPKALICVLSVCALLYSLLTFVCFGILGQNVGTSTLAAADAFKVIFNQFGYNFIILGMLVSIGGLTISFAMNAPQIASSLSRNGLFPMFLSKSNTKGNAYFSTIFTFLGSMILVCIGNFDWLLLLSVFLSFIQYVVCILSLIKLKYDGIEASFHVPFGYLVPILALVSSLYLMTGFSKDMVVVGVVILLIGVLLYSIDAYIKVYLSKKQG
ncbi:MAG: APC family permease [Erysipelotrichaceae bacterium]